VRIAFFNLGVGIGTYPSHLLELIGGAYSDGATWVDASSRELKGNINEFSLEVAVAVLEDLKPVSFDGLVKSPQNGFFVS